MLLFYNNDIRVDVQGERIAPCTPMLKYLENNLPERSIWPPAVIYCYYLCGYREVRSPKAGQV